MTALELVRLALSRLASARLRSALTMLGIIIGVASVVALVGVGQGATSGITNRLEGLGTNLLTVNPGSSTAGLTRQGSGSATTLTIDDASAIAALAGVAGVAPQVTTQALVVAGSKNTTTQVVGTTAAYADVRAFSIWQGSFLNDAAVEHGLRVAVLGSTTADDLGLTAGSIGTDITIGKVPYRLIGILQAKGGGGFSSQDDMVVVPLTTVKHYLVPGDSVRSISLSVASADRIESVKATIKLTLEERHGISASGTDDFTITDQAQLLETAASVGSLLAILLAGIASISLVVGGIGVMNIMLVSVRERTREIGIRKAIGARGSDILAQFLVEALALSVLGGLIGAAVGIGLSIVIATVAGWAFTFNPLTVIAALGVSLGVGVLFGVWPARQASRLDPIVALHYE